MNQLTVLPILIPLVTAALCLLVWRSRLAQRLCGVAGAAAQTASAVLLLAAVRSDGIQVLRVGSWPAPFGVTLVADLFSGIMVVVAAVMGLSVAVYSLGAMDAQRESFGYHPLFHILLMGVSGAFLTGDVFNLYVWFEVMLIASFVLLCLGGERAQIEGAIKYVTLNLIASALFLAAAAVLYGTVGSLNFADLSRALAARPGDGIITGLAMLFLVAFGIKAAVFPLFFWLPASYHTPPIAVSAIFAGLLTKVGVYALIRVFSLLFVHDAEFTHRLILIVAGLTMVTGVLGAFAHHEMRRILSFHIVSQIGYMIMGLGLFTPLAMAGSVFYIVHHIVVKTNLFLVSGIVHRLRGSYELKHLGGLYRTHPWLAALFLIPALSLAGVPPLSGFFAKLILIKASLDGGHYLIAAVALLVGLLTLLSMTKIWNEVFWKPRPDVDETPAGKLSWRWAAPAVFLAASTIVIGAASGPFFALARQTGEQLMNPAGYVAAVLGVFP